MEPFLTDTLYCSGCKTFKLSSAFTDNETRGASKKFKTCDSCHQRFSNKRKKPIRMDDNLLDSELEIIDLDFLSESVTGSLENVQSEFHFHREINISSYNNSSKDLINEIVELIEDANEYSWIYNRQYKSKESITYWYYCSQRNTLLKNHAKMLIL